MKKTIYLIFSLLCSCQLFANNLSIGVPTYDGTAHTLTFTIKWDNAWRVNSGPSNYDAVWVFVKRQPCGANGIWSHALLSTTSANHSVSGANNLVADAVSDGMGVFIHLGSSANNQIIGSLTSSTVVLKLTENYNPALIGSTSATSDNWKVFGVEMVYVPQGEFYLGDGRPSNTNNFSAGNTNQPLKITNAIQNINGLGSYSNYVSQPYLGCAVTLPTTFPIGFNGFYCMKYEIVQGQMADYYNCLSYEQQAARLKISSNRLLTSINQYFGENWGSISLYNATTGTNNTIPATVTSAYPHLPMGYMNWQDLTSYLDWSGLRPMTEFEFEKASRGNNAGTAITPIANEFPWGSTIITNGNIGNYIYYQTSPTAVWNTYDGACRYSEDNGPIRGGFGATGTSNRSQAGATYYGIMEMGGNVWEQCVGGGNGYDYSGFTTNNGDGILTTTGLANATGWPKLGGASSGTILRGGSFNVYNSINLIQVSDRTYHAGDNGMNGSLWRDRSVGGRGVRSF